MRYSRQHKDRSRRRIVESATHLFAAGGYGATSIEDIMRDCGLTRGAFYAHFRSKRSLYDEAIGQAAASGALTRDATGRIGEDNWLESMLYEDGEASGLGFLAADVASDEPEVRSAYGRAVAQATDDSELRRKLLASCRESARAILESGSRPLSFFWEPPA